MFSIPRLLVGVVSAIGGTAAISVPVALSASRSSRMRRDLSDSVNTSGGGVDQVSLSRCVEPVKGELEFVNFGEDKVKKVCWKAETNKEDLTKSEEWTALFKEQWKEKDRKWNSNNNSSWWMTQCLDYSNYSQWAVTTNSDSGTQYLGHCKEAEVNQTKFVKKVEKGILPESSTKWALWICDKDCWSLNTSTFGGSAEILEKEKEGNWKEVTFYRG